MDNLQRDITIIDVAPRDGLQNEPEILPVVTKVALIRRLVESGIPWVEIGAFVNPRQVPQQAGTTEVAMALTDGETARFTCLIPNMRGYELAVAAGMRHVRLVLAASESLNQANFKRSVSDSLADFAHIAGQATRVGVAFVIRCEIGHRRPYPCTTMLLQQNHRPAELRSLRRTRPVRT